MLLMLPILSITGLSPGIPSDPGVTGTLLVVGVEGVVGMVTLKEGEFFVGVPVGVDGEEDE